MSSRARVYSVGMLLASCVMLSAADKVVPTVIRTWNLTPWTGLADTLSRVDSSYLNLPMRNRLTDYSISMTHNSNIVSPSQSRLFFDRRHDVDFLFADAYLPYVITPNQVKFYHTTTPYSTIAYKKGFVNSHEENDLSFSFTGNLNRKTNLGATIDYQNSYGRFTNQQGKNVMGSLFGSYNGDHYSFQGAFTFTTLSNFENGGLAYPEDLQSTLKPEDMPVKMQGMSGFRYLSGYVNHYYSICVERERKVHYRERDEEGKWQQKDTTLIEYVPVTTFRHVFEVSDATKRYVEKTANQSFYQSPLLRDPNRTRDTAACLTLRNTLSVTFEEEFNTLLKFGAIVYATQETQRHISARGQSERLIAQEPIILPWSNVPVYDAHRMPDTLYGQQWSNSTYVGGALYKNMGKYIHYGFDGNVCLIGYKLGEFQVNGHIDGGFRLGKDSLTLSATAYFKNETPDWYVQYYRSNHFQWTNSFVKPMRFHVGGQVAYPTTWVKPRLKVDFENITRYIYFNEQGYPVQIDGNVQVLAADLQLDITTPWVNLDNSVVWQHATMDCVPLPALTLYNNLYYHGVWWKALDAQIGVDMRFFTRYYAPVLCPATGQFCVQNTQMVGAYPLCSVYANFYVRSIRLKFFAQYQHFNASFSNKQYYEMPGYPQNPDQFRAGLAWHFYK